MFEVHSPEKWRQVREKDWSQQVEHMQGPNGTGPGVNYGNHHGRNVESTITLLTIMIACMIVTKGPPMNCAVLVFLINVIRNTNTAQFIGGSNDLISFDCY